MAMLLAAYRFLAVVNARIPGLAHVSPGHRIHIRWSRRTLA
jgi:hypothetical protein